MRTHAHPPTHAPHVFLEAITKAPRDGAERKMGVGGGGAGVSDTNDAGSNMVRTIVRQ